MTPTTKRPDPARVGGLLGRLALVLVVTCGSGATCSSRLRAPFVNTPVAPHLLSPSATAAQIVAVVNQNSSRVATYVTNNASISMPGDLGLPLLRGNIAVQLPRRLRLRAGTALTGAEVDFGSNDELFWMWSKRNEPPGVYYARHATPDGSAVPHSLPIDPQWVLDALGLVTLDPSAAYQGPLARPDGNLELRTNVATAFGPRQRAYVIDAAHGWVLEQHAYEANGTLLASATAEDFRYDPVSQTSLPRRVRLQVPAADIAFTINTGGVVVNSAIANPQQLFGLPSFDGYPAIDLATRLGTIVDTPSRKLGEAPLADAAPSAPPAIRPPAAPSIARLPSGGVPLQR